MDDDIRHHVEVFDVEDAAGDITEAVYLDQLERWLAEHNRQVADEKQQRIDEALALVRTASGRYEQREAGGGLFSGQASDVGFINYIDRIEAALTGATSNDVRSEEER